VGVVNTGLRVRNDVLVDFLDQFELVFLIKRLQLLLFNSDSIGLDKFLQKGAESGFDRFLLFDHREYINICIFDIRIFIIYLYKII
jgi:hypothetical protein